MRGSAPVCCDVLLRERPPFPQSEDAEHVHLDLDPVPASVARARGFVRDTLADTVEDCRDIAVLLVSELVTNAVLHARTEVRLGVVHDGEHVLVCVADRRDDTAVLVPLEKSRERHGGRGLALVEELAGTWGTERYTGGKTVWFVVSATDEAVKAG